MSTKSTTLTSKNQVTLPAVLVRRAGLTKGVRLSVRLENGTIVLEPQAEVRRMVEEIQAALRPKVRKPLSDIELQAALRGWSKK